MSGSESEVESQAGSGAVTGNRARVVLATRNAHKVGEVRAILAEALAGTVSEQLLASAVVGVGDFDVPEVAEVGVTFAQNALLKAHAACTATGLPALADDSGLCVDVMGGAPGIFSARWSGTHGRDIDNLRLLLDQVADVPDEHRGAAFVAAVALVLPDGTEHVEHGRAPGTLTREPSGGGGFGYDPILRVDGDTRTMAELTPTEKNAISHRGQALRAMAPRLVSFLE
ncbi:MAG: RdgB/HAM1 family non-canonical purine NTP pyrophosphatase [Actinomycetales bacterium]